MQETQGIRIRQKSSALIIIKKEFLIFLKLNLITDSQIQKVHNLDSI